VEGAKKSIGQTRVRGRLTVTTSFTFGMHWLMPRLPALLAAHPELTLDVRLDDNATDLIVEGVDLVLRAGMPIPETDRLIAKQLHEFQRIVVAAPAYLREHGVPTEPDALAHHDAIVQLVASGPLHNWVLTRGKQHTTVSVRGRLRLSAPMAIHHAAVAGLGVAWMPSWLVHNDIGAGRLQRLFPDWSSPASSAWAIYRTEARRSAPLLAVLKALSQSDS
jgi:DNA-binding transcriptional LysR family regulator